ncbi:hypothetical protein OC845_005373 [Tilletia horrida]|nr:hypothetical protein OC845_005373 [Tilletia horrida]
MSAVPILLASDGISPMAGPSNLPAVHFPRALAEIVSGASSAKAAADQIDTHLKQRGWEPTWRFRMYTQPHYHATAHELLAVYSGSATIRLGGSGKPSRHPLLSPTNSTDQMPTTSSTTTTTSNEDKVEAQDSNSSAKTTTTTTTATLELQPGDLLLLPAGYTHSALTQSTTPPFMMVGSYPQGAAPWDMQFPTTSAECDKLATSIKDNLLERFRKGLFEAQDPVELSADQGLSQLWDVRSV